MRISVSMYRGVTSFGGSSAFGVVFRMLGARVEKVAIV